MTYLTGQEILNDAISIITDQSSTTRANMLGWLNVVAQKVAVERTWQFLNSASGLIAPIPETTFTGDEGTSPVPVNRAYITLPADYGEFRFLQSGSTFYFDSRNKLTEGEAWQADTQFIGNVSPVGYTEHGGRIYLHGGATTDPVLLGYVIEPQAIIDSADATCWPKKCKGLFQEALLTFFYEFDMDERKAARGLDLPPGPLSVLKAWDNTQKPKTQNSRHGYMKTR